MIRTSFFATVALSLTFAAPVLAEDVSKEEDCRFQSDVVAAIQAARLDRVKEDKLVETIAGTNPEWPDRYNNAISILAGPIYDMKRRDLKKADLKTQWNDACLGQ